jgi:hypothetical protein
MGVPGVGREDLDVEVEVWLLGGYPSIVIDHGGLAMWNVNPWLNATSSVLRVRANDFEAVAVDAPREGMPEGILDHARQTIDRVLGETSLVEDYPLPIMIAS